MKLKPYPEYKDASVPWLGKVPTHWEIERLKSLMSNSIQQTAEQQSSDCTSLSNTSKAKQVALGR